MRYSTVQRTNLRPEGISEKPTNKEIQLKSFCITSKIHKTLISFTVEINCNSEAGQKRLN